LSECRSKYPNSEQPKAFFPMGKRLWLFLLVTEGAGVFSPLNGSKLTEHFTETQEGLVDAFDRAGLSARLHRLEPGIPTKCDCPI
jgi:hypothetical protein